MKTLNVVGCGKVGQTLARVLHAGHACVVQDLKGIDLSEANRAAEFIQAGRPAESLRDMRPADLWLVTVPDTKIASVAAEIAAAIGASSPAVAFHCSGFLPASTLAPLRDLGWSLASVHPVLTFADPAAAVTQFPGTPCGVEGDEAALHVLRPLFAAIGARCFAVQTDRKPLYHAAAVFSNNFTVVLQTIAREAWAAAGVPDDLAPTIQASLLKATVENVVELGPRAITGPAARGDAQVVRSQGADVFRWNPDAGVVYHELSRLARRLSLHQSTLRTDIGD
ncbi:Rossmann-like and DUF2520 domain-containing protein [Ramlibacter sp.]|uniref:Rossmann-like and DUF2520 domain-containing protein n=1 Tax=Ramlibacter sp. TaxID=1917967 RepID=UPI003D0D7AE1